MNQVSMATFSFPPQGESIHSLPWKFRLSKSESERVEKYLIVERKIECSRIKREIVEEANDENDHCGLNVTQMKRQTGAIEAALTSRNVFKHRRRKQTIPLGITLINPSHDK